MGLAEPELGGDPSLVDVVGLNFYPHNQWYLEGPTIPMGHHEYRRCRHARRGRERYGKPVFISETGAEGSGRPAWLHYVCTKFARRAPGRDIRGICMYPVTAYPGWDNSRHCRRRPVLADHLRRKAACRRSRSPRSCSVSGRYLGVDEAPKVRRLRVAR